MKNIYENQRFVHLTGATVLTFLLVLLLALPSRMIGGTISGIFTTLPDCPQSLNAMCIDPASGFMYALGNDNSSAYFKYDIALGTWTTLASASHITDNNAGATLVNGKIYISYTEYADLEVYTIATNSWATLTGPPSSDGTGNISNDGTNLYIACEGTPGDFWRYNIAAGTYTALASAPVVEKWGGLAYKNGYFYCSEGNGNTGFSRYHVATNTWEVLTAVPDGAVLGAAIYDAYYYCMGGYGGSNLYSYDLGAQEWNNTLTLPWEIDDASICVYNGSLYIFQGEAGTGFTKFTPNNPMLTNMEPIPLRYTLGAAAKVITSTLTASQNTGTNFVSGTVTISGNFESGKDVLSFVNAYGITGSWNSTTGVLTLTGTTTIANYQAALRSVKYSNTVGSSGATRTIDFSVTDGVLNSNTASRDVLAPGPPSVSTAAISAISATSATSGGNVLDDGGATVTVRGVCWNNVGTPVTANPNTTNGTGMGAFTSSITGLINGTTWYVRAYATNSYGTSYGSEESFVAADYPPTVTTTAISAINATSATSGGDVTIAGSYPVTARGVCWNTIGSPTTADPKTSNGTGTGAFTSSITGLTLGTTYYVRAYATSSAGTSYGNELYFMATDGPTVDAGPDATTCDTDYEVSGSTGGPYSVNYTEWSTGGDGYFDNTSSLATTYYPGSGDISTGFVTLTLFAEFSDPATTTLTDDMTLTISNTVGGAISPTIGGVCAGTNSTLLTLENYTGTIQKWQYSANGTDAWTDIAASTASTYTATDLSASRYYRVVVKNGTCYAANSELALINAEVTPVSGSLAKTPDVATVFDGTDVSAVLTPGTGGKGTDALLYRTKTGAVWSAPLAYTSGTAIATTGKTGVNIYTWREFTYCDPGSSIVSVEWTVELKPTPGAIAASQTICYNTTPAAFTSTTAGTGIGTISYEWQTNASGSYVTISGATVATYQAPTLTATTSYQRRTVAYSGGTYYYSDYTTPVTITVQSTPTAGAIATDQTVCYGTAPALLTSTAGTGSGTISYEWQTNASGSYLNISGATAATYQPPSLTSTRSYQRRTVSTLNGNVCYSDYTTPVVITVQTVPLSFPLGTAQTICYNTAPAPLTSDAGTGSGTISYEWQTNASGSYLDISGATDVSYQPPALTATTSYKKRTVSTLNGNSCYSVYSNIVTITVQSIPGAGAIGTAQTICYNTTPNALSSLVLTPGSPSISYEWQTNASGSYADISGATAASYQPPALTATTSYQRRTVSTLNGNVCYSGYTTPVTITVQSTPTAGATSSNQIICYNTVPALITSITEGTGSGTISYEWTTASNGSPWHNVTGATQATYQPPALTASTNYARRTVSTLNGNSCYSVYANEVVITVQTTPTAGAIATAQTICSNTAPALLTSATVGTGDGTISYEWQTNASGSYVTIDGATDATYQPPTLTAATSYKRRTVSTSWGTSCYSVYTTPVTITIDPVSVGGTVGTSTHVCTGTNSTLLTLTGKTGVVQRWQYSTNSGTDWTDINSATNTTYTATNLTVTTDYRAVVKSGTCPEAYSVAATITVDPTSNGGNVSGSSIVCYGTNSTLLTLYGQTGTVVKWQYTSDGGYHWIDIASATNTTYTATNLTTTTSFRVVVQSGVCGATPGGYANVTVRTQFVAPVASGAQTICWNTTAGSLSATAAAGGTGPFSYQWQYSYDQSTWEDIEGETSLSLLPGDLYETTYYRLLATDQGTPSCSLDVPSNTVTVTVRDPFTASELSIAGDQASTCYNTAPGLITATPTTGGSGPPFTYQWQMKTTGSWTNTGTNSLTYQPGNLTVYTQFRLIAYDGGVPSCGAVFSLNNIALTIDPLPDAIAGDDRAICLNESTTLGRPPLKSSSNTYSWTSVPAGFTSTLARPIVSPTVTTTYTLVETITATGCINSHSVTVTVNPLPAAVAGADRPICLNASTTIGAAAVSGNTYAWTSVPAGFTSTLANPTVSPTVTTTYTVVETITLTGCNNTHDVTVTVNPLPVAASGSDRDICLNGSTTLGAAAVSGSTYSWSSTPAGFTSTLAEPTVSPTVTTTYTVVETITATGCSNNNAVVVTVNPLPAAVAGADRAICLNESTTLGAPPLKTTGNSFSWTSVPAGFTSTLANPVVSPTVTTTYTVTETITLTGCTNTHSVTVTVNPLPAAIAGADRAICLNESTTLGAPPLKIPNNSFSWTSVPVGFTSTLARPVVSPTVTTTYTVVETINLTGCTNSNSVTVTVNPLPAAEAGADRDICLNESTDIGATAVTGNTYSWTSVPAGFTSALANPNVSPTVTTTYSVVETITATGCHNTHSVVVTVNPLPPAIAGADREICLNASTTLGASTLKGISSTFSWTSVPAGFTSTLARPSVSPTVTTVYTVEETYTATGCTNSNSVTVTVNPLPEAAAGSDRDICLNGSTTLGASAVTGSTYSWTSAPAGFTSALAEPTVSPTVTTTYTVVETFTATGCANNNSVVVTVNPLPVAAAGSAGTICYGSSTSIGAAAVTGSTYSWSSVPAGFTSTLANPTVSPTVTTTYTVAETITLTGCTHSNSVILTVRPEFIQASCAADHQQICYNNHAAPIVATPASGGSGGYTYQWQYSDNGTGGWNNIAGATTLTYSSGILISTIYYRILTTDIGTPCCGTDVAGNAVEVIVNDPLYPSVVTINPSTTAICLNATPGLLSATAATGGTGPFTYQWQKRLTAVGAWTNVGPNTIGNTTYQPGPALVNTYYRVIAKDIGLPSCGSTFSNAVYITILPIPAAVAGSDATICNGFSASLGATAVSGSTYSWSSVPAGYSSTLSNPTVSPTVTTTYTVVETITATGCTNSHSVTITVNPLPAAAAGSDRDICLNASTTLGADAIAGSTYSWSAVPSGFTSTLANPAVSPTVTTTYTVVETITATGCTDTHSVTVTVNPLPEAIAGADRAICLNESTILGAPPLRTTGNSFSWTSVPAGFTSTLANPEVSPSVTTTYTVVETITLTGCTNTHSVTVTVNPLPDADAGADRDICLNESTTLGAPPLKNGSVNLFSWTSDPVGFTSTLARPVVSPTVTTTYTVVETIVLTGCTNTHSVTVTVNPLPLAVAGDDRAICLNESTTLGAPISKTPGNTFSWTSVPAGFTSTLANPVVSPTVTTTYTVVETILLTGCTNSHSVTVTVNPLPDAVAGDDRAICLNESTTLGAQDTKGLENSFSWTSVPVGFTSSLARPVVSPTVTTTYTVVETIDLTGCSNTHSVTVTVNPLPDAVTGDDRAICLNENTTIGAAAVAGNTYSWSSTPAGFTSTLANPTVSPVVTRTYTLVEAITLTGCTNIRSVTVTVNPLPAAVAGSDRAICLNANTTLGGSVVTGSTYIWSSNPSGFTSTEANPMVSPTITTTYSVVETITATGCTNTHDVTVTVNPLPAAIAGADRAICLNESTTLGAPPLKYVTNTFSWTSSPAGFTSTLARPVVSPTVTTTYTVVETILLTGCTNTHSVTVTVNPLPDAIAGADRAICLNESTDIGAAAVDGNTYSWTSVPAGFTSALANPTVSPTVTTTYSVVETITATGCSNTHSVTVTVNPLPAAIAGADREICLNESTTLGAPPLKYTSNSFSWTSVPVGFTSTLARPVVSPTVTTTYTVVETIDLTGCTNTHSVTVTVNPLPDAVAGDDRAICLNDNTTLGSDAVTGSTYSWSAVPAGFTSTLANPLVSPTVTTTYTVVETITATGCTNTNSVIVTVNPLPAAVAGSDRAICLNENTTIGASSVTGNTYSWTAVPSGFTSTEANPSVSPVVTTTYTLVETVSLTGCSNTHSVTVTVNPLPSAIAGADRDICLNESTTLGAPPLKNGSSNLFSWTSVPVGFTSTLARPVVSPTVTTTYTVVETIVLTGCTNTHSVTVTVNPLPDAVAGADRAICLNESTDIGEVAVTGNTYSWTSVPAGYTSALANPTVSPTVTTTYTVVETITATGCNNTHSVTVTVNPLPEAVAGDDRAICLNESTTLGAPDSKILLNSFSWTSVPVGFTSTLARPVVSPTVTTTYTVVETILLTGCNNTHSVTVTVNPLPAAVAGADRDICLNDNTTLGADAVSGSTYSWSAVPAGFTSALANPVVSPTVTTTYTVVETITLTGCINTNSVTVTVNPLPEALAGADRAICLNESTTLGGPALKTSSNSFSWTSVPAGFTSTLARPIVSPTVTTTYTVVETITLTGCTNTHSVTVTVNPLPAAIAGADREICLNESTTLGAPPLKNGVGNSFSWTSVPVGFTSTLANPVVSPTVTTTYTVVETITLTGCTNTNSVTVTVNPLPEAVAGADREICLNESTTLGAPQLKTTGNSFSWTSVPAGFTSTLARPVVSPTVTTTYTVVETIILTGCTNTHSVTVTVNPLPEAVAGADRAICLNESTTLGAPPLKTILNSFSWTSVPVGFTSTLARPVVSPTVTTTYTVVETILLTGCNNTHSVTVTVNPLPVAVAGTDRDICFNSNTIIGAEAVAGSTYSWTAVPAGFTSALANPTVSPTVTTTYTVVETITLTGCTNTHSVTVTVIPLSYLSGTLTPSAICSGATFGYTATSATAGATFAWSRATVAGITEPGTSGTVDVSEVLTNTTTSPIAVTYVYITTANGCSNAGENVVVTVNPIPVLSSTLTPASVCNGVTFGYTALSATPGATFAWSRATITGITQAGTTGAGNVSEMLSNTTTAPIDVTYVYTTTANGCSNTFQDVVVKVNPTAVLSSTLTPAAINSAVTFVYTAASATTGATFTWSRATIAGITQPGSSGSGNVSEKLTNTSTLPIAVTYLYTTTINGCSNAPEHVVVTVYPTADLSSTLTPPAVCSAAPFIYTATSTTPGATFAWTRATLAGVIPVGTGGTGNVFEVLINTTTAPIAVMYVYTTTVNGYSNTPQNVVVMLNPTPALSSSLTPPGICSGSVFSYTATSATPGSTYGWSRATKPGIIQPGRSGTGNVNEVLTSSVAAPVNVTYVYTTTANGCSGASQQVVVTVSPVLPVSLTITADATEVCMGTVVHFTATPVNGGITPGYQWKLNNSNVTGATNSTYSLTTYAVGTSVSCVLTSSATPCTTGNPATSNTVFITVTDICPTVDVVGIVADGETMCYNASQTITVAGNGTTFTVNSGGHATMIAGQNIIYNPGTTVYAGGYMRGYISETDRCGAKSASIVNAGSGEDEQVFVQKTAFRLYPNPTTGTFTVEQTRGVLHEVVKVEIYSMLGGKVMTGQLNGETKREFSISEFPVGVYFVKVLAGSEAETIKLIKVN
ncbi:MAG: T9SS type A sorting domain-containing protein [Bacteroidetes bacterium]|nr:T9SS type A sorting domain-containing protein [Bacteroidota bacterium]